MISVNVEHVVEHPDGVSIGVTVYTCWFEYHDGPGLNCWCESYMEPQAPTDEVEKLVWDMALGELNKAINSALEDEYAWRTERGQH